MLLSDWIIDLVVLSSGGRNELSVVEIIVDFYWEREALESI